MQAYNSYMEINENNFINNIAYIQNEVGGSCKVIPVLKGNAYGHGAARLANICEKELHIDAVGVAQLVEAGELRAAGYKKSIMLFAIVPAIYYKEALELDAVIPVSSAEEAKALSHEALKQGKKYASVQLAVDTGLHRLGAQPGEEFDAVLDCVKSLKNLYVKGVYTHFADAENIGSKYAVLQYEKFLQALEQVKSHGIEPELIHASNSAATEWLPQARFNAVRIGRRLYMDNRNLIFKGIEPDELPIKEVASFRSHIVDIKTVPAGERAGYNEDYRTSRITKIATVCAGYCDGVQKSFVAKNVPVLAGNFEAKYIGVCMDQTLLDVTGIDCKIGGEVTFWGRSSDGVMLSSQYVGELVGEEGVYLTSMLTNRVKRIYVK